MSNETREQLAEYAHEAWSGWMKYMFEKGYLLDMERPGDGKLERCYVMPQWAVERWQRQMNTPYADLPESEKESDRKEADQMLAITKAPELLEAVKLAYRKHHLEDESVSWGELSDTLLDALCEAIGDEAFLKWSEEVKP